MALTAGSIKKILQGVSDETLVYIDANEECYSEADTLMMRNDDKGNPYIVFASQGGDAPEEEEASDCGTCE